MRFEAKHISSTISSLSEQYPIIMNDVDTGLCRKSPHNIVTSLLYGVYSRQFNEVFANSPHIPRMIRHPYEIEHNVPIVYFDNERSQEVFVTNPVPDILVKYAVGLRGSGVVLTGEYAGSLVAKTENAICLVRPWNDSYFSLVDIPTPSVLSKKEESPPDAILEHHAKLFHELYEMHFNVVTRGGTKSKLLSEVFFDMCENLAIPVDRDHFQTIFTY